MVMIMVMVLLGILVKKERETIIGKLVKKEG